MCGDGTATGHDGIRDRASHNGPCTERFQPVTVTLYKVIAAVSQAHPCRWYSLPEWLATAKHSSLYGSKVTIFAGGGTELAIRLSQYGAADTKTGHYTVELQCHEIH